MASLLNNASLLLNPAGSVIAYEEDKIFSVLPTNGTGDFTFTGGDGGTRVNQQGYIEQTPANLVTYSEDFSNWTGNLFNNWVNCAVTTNFAVAPNGTLTADRLGDGYSRFNQSATAIPGQTYTFSIYLKNISLTTNFYARVAWGLNGILVSHIGIGSIINVSALSTTEWTRLSFTTTAPSSGINQMQFGPAPFTGYGTNPAGTFILAWGGMVNIGSTALPYQPTTDRLNYPRIDYQNGRGALLQEPQRTNIVLNSTVGNYGNAPGSSTNTISPDGTNNATIPVPNANADRYQETILGGVYATNTKLTYSWHYKQLASHAGINPNEPGGLDVSGLVNCSLVGSVTKLYDLADGWSRWQATYNITNGSIDAIIRLYFGRVIGIGYSSSAYYGHQLEVGEFATSYIPTTSATVTRPMDQFSKNDSPALTTTDWTFYMSGVDIGKNKNIGGGNISNVNWSFDSGGGAYGPNSLHNYSNNLYYYTTGLATLLGTIGSNAQKIAVTKTGNTFKFFRNGVLIQTTSPTLGNNTWDSFRMYGNTDGIGKAFSNNPSTLSIIQTAFSDSDAQTLTTINSGSGGTISYYGPYTIHTFTSSATFTPSFNGEVEVLVVAGGGAGGGGDVGGGGGAGGLLYVSSYGVSSGTGITVTIGAGGAGVASAGSAGGNGSNSVFGGLTAIGGGGGAGWTKGTGNDGGSGGGSTYYGVGGSGIPGQGNNGGTGGIAAPPYPQCGGGGAGEAGFPNQSSTVAGNGGDGLPYSISGFSTYYAGGGGGATEGNASVPGTPGTGGLGGGGDGGSQGAGTLGKNGVDGLGGGGGGCDPQAGATGGSGIVIVRYLT